jgi:hypothetical protein
MMSDSIISIRMKFFMMIKKIHKWRDLVMFVFVKVKSMEKPIHIFCACSENSNKKIKNRILKF